MFSKKYSSEGIVLSRKSKGEADRLISVITRNNGRKEFLAKGVRKLSSRKRGHIEVFSHIRFSAVKGDIFDLLTEVELIDAFALLRQDLVKVSVAYFLVEVAKKVAENGTKDNKVFDILLTYLKKLETSKNLKKLRSDFTTDLLTTIGFWPEGKELPDADRLLDEVIERKLSSPRIGKKVLT